MWSQITTLQQHGATLVGREMWEGWIFLGEGVWSEGSSGPGGRTARNPISLSRLKILHGLLKPVPAIELVHIHTQTHWVFWVQPGVKELIPPYSEETSSTLFVCAGFRRILL